MVSPIIWIVGGSLLILIGGIIATSGWNKRAVVNQKNSIIRAVVQEWKMNIYIIRSQVFEETNEEKLSKYVAFPRMQTVVLAGALSSGHFTDKSDPKFWIQALSLNEVLGSFNNRLRITENKMDRTPDSISVWRTELRDGQTRTCIMEKLLLFGIMLNSEYRNMLINEYGEKLVSIEELDKMKREIKSAKNSKNHKNVPISK